MPTTARELRPPGRPRPRPAWATRRRLRRRPVLWWTTTLALSALTAWVVGGAIAGVEAKAARYGDATPVLVATRAIEAGAVVDEGNAELQHLPAALVPAGAATAGAVGSRATHPIHAGEVVHERRLAPAGRSVVTSRLPPGTRGIAVPAGTDGLALEVGDTVDVLATVDALEGPAPTVTVATSAVVVDVGEAAVTVAVSTEQAPKVAYAVVAGLVTLALVAG